MVLVLAESMRGGKATCAAGSRTFLTGYPYRRSLRANLQPPQFLRFQNNGTAHAPRDLARRFELCAGKSPVALPVHRTARSANRHRPVARAGVVGLGSGLQLADLAT